MVHEIVMPQIVRYNIYNAMMVQKVKNILGQ
jgi:hypothetical protein